MLFEQLHTTTATHEADFPQPVPSAGPNDPSEGHREQDDETAAHPEPPTAREQVDNLMTTLKATGLDFFGAAEELRNLLLTDDPDHTTLPLRNELAAQVYLARKATHLAELPEEKCPFCTRAWRKHKWEASNRWKHIRTYIHIAEMHEADVREVRRLAKRLAPTC